MVLKCLSLNYSGGEPKGYNMTRSRKCINCGTVFPSVTNKIYCNLKCRKEFYSKFGKFKRKHDTEDIIKVCAYCNVVKIVGINDDNFRSRYCSEECYLEAKKEKDNARYKTCHYRSVSKKACHRVNVRNRKKKRQERKNKENE